MSGNRRDVNLVIRAKDEASRAFEQAAAALESIFKANNRVSGSAQATGTALGDLATIAATLDRVYTQVNGAADSAADSFARQTAAIAKQRAELAALQTQSKGAAAVIERLSGADAIVSAGRDQSGRIAQLQEVTAVYQRLEQQQKRLAATINIAQAELDGQASSLQRIGSTAIATDKAREQLAATIERETRALREQAAAASVVENIDRSTGVNRGDRGDYELLIGQIREASAARDAEIGKLKAEQLATVELSRAKTEYARINKALSSGSRPVSFGEGAKGSAAASAAVFRDAEAKSAENLAKAIGDAARAAKGEAEAVARLKAEVDPLGVAQAALSAELASVQALLDRGAISLGVYTAKIAKLNAEFAQLKSSHSKMDPKEVQNLAKGIGDAVRAASDEADEIARLKGELAPLAAAEAAAAVQAQKLARWFQEGRIDAKEYDGAVKLLNQDLLRMKNSQSGIDAKGRPSLFGLKPYEVQNLGYQINDVITQLASGTSLSQTLAQQGGQLIQLFPKVGSAIVAGLSSGPIILFVATIGTLIAAVNAAADAAERLRKFDGILAANADGASHSAKALADTAHALDQYGLSAEDALKITRTLLNDGFDDSQVLALGKTSKDLADVLGIDVADAAKQVGDAFRGSYDSIKKLDDGMNFLSASERERIKLLFEQGRADDARAMALDIFSRKMEDAANKMRGSWSDAARSLGNAWTAFTDAIAETGVIDNMGKALDKLGRKTTNLINRLRGVRELQNVDNDIKDIQERIDQRNSGGAGIIGAAVIDKFSGSNAQKDQETLNNLLRERERILGRMNGQQDASNGKARELTELQKKANGDLASATQQLRLQGNLLGDRGRLQLTYNEALLEAQRLFPNSTAELQRQYALTKQKIEQVRIDKQHADEAKRAADQAERERRERERQAKDPAFQASTLIKQFEGFIPKAKFDVNAFRVGFGSDTTTRMDGTVQRVTRNTTTTLEDANRDLERRIAEFQRVVKEQIGSDRFASFGAQQQAALTSIAYNYGSLPERIVGAVRSGTTAEIAAAVRGLGGDNNGINRGRRNKEADILGTPNLAVEADTQKQIDDLIAKQDKYIEKVTEGVDARELENTFLSRQEGLVGNALLDEQRRAFIAQETLKAQEEADKLDITRDDPRWETLIDRVKRAAGAYFDLSHAKEKAANARNVVEQPVTDLTAQRDALQQQIEVFRDRGNFDMVDTLEPQLDTLNAKLGVAIQKVITFWKAVMAGASGGAAAFGMTNAQIQAMITGLETAGLSTQKLSKFLGLTADNIAQAFTGAAVNGIDQFAQAVANGEKVFKSLAQAFRQFAADFLRQIAQMILQQIIFNAVKKGLNSIGVGVAHSGGVIGGIGRQRSVSPEWFASATRYHSGGVAGLRPNEVPAILERGEEVLTADDPRHRRNGGGGGGGAPSIKIVNAFDAADMLSKGLDTASGQSAILNFVRANPGAFKQAMGQ